jgi:hypothetical protein
MSHQVSRRTLLAGAGVAAAAATVGTGLGAAEASTFRGPGGADGDPLRPGAVASTSAGGLTAEALTPGLAYLTIDGAAYSP